MNAVMLTDKSILDLAVGDHRDKIINDLRVRVGRKSRSFYVAAMVARKRKHEVLGRYPGLTIADARKKALERVNEWTARRKSEAPVTAAEVPTLARCIDQHIADSNDLRARKGRRPMKSEKLLRDSLAHHFKDWLDSPVTVITPEVMRERARGVPGRTLACLRAVLRVPIKSKKIEDPFALLQKGVVGASGERSLVTELRHDMNVLSNVIQAIRSYPSLDIRVFGEFLLFSGRRPDELRHLKWEDLDFERSLYKIRSHKTSRDAEDFLCAPLSAHLLALLKSWKATHDLNLKNDGRDAYVFPASQAGTAEPFLSLSGYRGVARHIKKECGFGKFVTYQFRKIFYSTATACGITEDNTAFLMGHKAKGIRGRYSFSQAEGMREPLEVITAKLLAYKADVARGTARA